MRKPWASVRRATIGSPARHGDRRLATIPQVWPWHEARAKGQTELFERVSSCGDRVQIRMWCESDRCVAKRAAGDRSAGVQCFPVGCSNRYFCDECKQIQAWRFRRDFSAARAGLVWRASLQGLTSRWRPKFGREARFSERLITLTTPEVGTVEERIRWEYDAWTPFLKRFNEYIRGELGATPLPAGKDSPAPVNDDGTPILTRELAHEVRFFEWTPGRDGNGHPHFHVWAFGPFVPVELIRQWWTEAWEEASGHEAPTMMVDGKPDRRLLVDVRKVEGESVEVRDADGKPVLGADGKPKRARIDHELIKYLTKQWSDAGRVSPEVFARVFAEVSPRRGRQPSRSFQAWAIPILRECPACGITHPIDDEDGPFRWLLEPVEATPLAFILARLRDAQPEARAGPALPAGDGWRFELVRDVETQAATLRGFQAGIRALSGRVY